MRWTCEKLNLLTLLLLSTACYSQMNSARFPGPRSELPSPDGRYELINTNSDREPHHTLFLKEKRTGELRKITDYERSVGVVWAPDSRHFAVNDYAGSNVTDTYIVATAGIAARIDVQDEINKKVKHLIGGDHEYFGVARWLDARRVIVHHWGHGDDGMFCECYIYVLRGPVRKCARQPKSSEPEERCAEITP
jgi:hypothetical protein